MHGSEIPTMSFQERCELCAVSCMIPYVDDSGQQAIMGYLPFSLVSACTSARESTMQRGNDFTREATNTSQRSTTNGAFFGAIAGTSGQSGSLSFRVAGL